MSKRMAIYARVGSTAQLGTESLNVQVAAVRGQMIRRMREEAGLTQTELGQRLDVGLNTVSRWETSGAPLTAFYATRCLLEHKGQARGR